jgi:hypothetical protein
MSIGVHMFTQIAAEHLIVDVLEFAVSPCPHGSFKNLDRIDRDFQPNGVKSILLPV